MVIERRVDWLGIPVRKVSVPAGYTEESSNEPPMVRESKPYAKATVLPGDRVDFSRGEIFSSVVDFGAGYRYVRRTVIYEQHTLWGDKIKKHAKFPRQSSGKRVSFRHI